MSNEVDETNQGGQRCEILLVEDNHVNQKVGKIMLGKLGLVPSIASSGQEAIESATGSRYDLILMDLHMPGMDGIEASRLLHEKLGGNCPPIVVLTADALFQHDGDLGEKGFSGFMTKPISAQTLQQCVLEQTGINL